MMSELEKCLDRFRYYCDVVGVDGYVQVLVDLESHKPFVIEYRHFFDNNARGIPIISARLPLDSTQRIDDLILVARERYHKLFGEPK